MDRNLPGRIEAMRIVLAVGRENAPPGMVHLARLDREVQKPLATQRPHDTMTMDSGVQDNLDNEF